MTASTKPGVWVIDVCATCDRLAVWPFCEHRPKVWNPGAPRWTRIVRVREVGRRG